jgi:AraC-like DNA-binding protein
LVQNHLEDIARDHYHRISKATGASREEIQQACRQIRNLDPRPIACFAPRAAPGYIMPDLLVTEEDGKQVITSADDFLPMLKVSTYIEQNLDQDIATTDVATFCQYSTEHFCRLFKKCFNKTFKSYLNIYRICRAKELIDSGKITTIAALSTTVGFNNQNHFGHMFKKYVGILPSEYISRQKSGTAKKK